MIIDLGKVAVTAEGNWKNNKSYEVLVCVVNDAETGGDGCGYISLKPNIGVRPGTDPTVWQKAVEAGASIYELCVKHGTFEGTEEEFVVAYNTAVQAAVDAAASAAAAERDIEAAERLREQAEQGRVEAEGQRALAEQGRDEAEGQRVLAERGRAEAEEGRSTTFARQSGQMVFFPIVFLFVIYEAIIRHKDKKRIWPALLLSVPFLLSGIAWNIIAAQQNPGTSVFFTESGNRLIPNLMAGALGLIGTTEGSTVQVFDNPGIVHAFFIAAASVMAHPVLYAKSICGRFVFLAENAKFLYVLVLLWLASAAILICQRSRFILLPLCAAYCFGVYIIMPVEQRYFVPAWFLMSVCAGIAAAHFFKKIFSKINIGHKPLANKTQFILFGTFFVPHIAIWIVSVVLLITFPMRRNLFDIDKAYSLFPNNKYLELCPLRKTYPRIWDYKAMSGLLKKTSDNLEFKMYKARWLDYFSVYRSEQENTADSDIPVTVFGKKTYITWPDILLKSIQNYKAGNKKEGRRLAEAAALSCMLSSGYIRTHTGENTSYNEQETEYADKLAIASAHVCSNHLTMMFMAIPPWEHKAKELMMADGFGKYIEEKGLINLYAERKSLECGECCVPNGFLEVPSKCGFAVKHFVSAYECFDDYVCKGPNWCRGQINPTLQEKNFCMELNRKLTENDIALAGKYPVLQNTFAYRVLAQTALTASLADIQAGDKSNAAINLLRAVAICPGVKNDSNYTYAYNRITGMQ